MWGMKERQQLRKRVCQEGRIWLDRCLKLLSRGTDSIASSKKILGKCTTSRFSQMGDKGSRDPALIYKISHTALSAPIIQLLHIPALRPPTPTLHDIWKLPHWYFVHSYKLLSRLVQQLSPAEQDRVKKRSFLSVWKLDKMLWGVRGNQLSQIKTFDSEVNHNKTSESGLKFKASLVNESWLMQKFLVLMHS